jgi:toxic protein SymE
MNPQEQLAAPNNSAKPRTLKVGYKPLKSPGAEVPFLPLRGQWLRDAGFEIGLSVKVEINEGRLTIERVE